MILTKQLLKQLRACNAGINLCEKGGLFGFDLNRIDEVIGDHNQFVYWINKNISNYNFTYDNTGKLVKKENDEGDWTKWEFDHRGNLIQEEHSYVFFINYYYDERNNKIRDEDASGTLREWEYDEMDRVIKKTIRSKFSRIIHTFTYDSNNNIVSETNHNYGITNRYEYDKHNNRIKEEVGVMNTDIILYEYDSKNLLVSRSHPKYNYVDFSIYTEYYTNGQLKRYGDMYIPLI
jgi:YD repeat-containing protein